MEPDKFPILCGMCKQAIKLGDEVESIFIEHFAGNDRKKAMKFLRPRQPKDSHLVTFFVGNNFFLSQLLSSLIVIIITYYDLC